MKTVNPRIKKYVEARVKGKSKKESALTAGYSEVTALHNTDKIEASKDYQVLARKYKDVLQTYITPDEVAEAHADNIRQDKDRGARNKAIEMYRNFTEEVEGGGSEEQIVVILR